MHAQRVRSLSTIPCEHIVVLLENNQVNPASTDFLNLSSNVTYVGNTLCIQHFLHMHTHAYVTMELSPLQPTEAHSAYQCSPCMYVHMYVP